MKKYIKITSIIIAIVLIITIPLLFLVKYDIYESCLLFNKGNKQYLVLNKNLYNKLKNNKNITLKNHEKYFKTYINYWSYNQSSNLWYSKIDLKQDIGEQSYQILLKRVNLLGF